MIYRILGILIPFFSLACNYSDLPTEGKSRQLGQIDGRNILSLTDPSKSLVSGTANLAEAYKAEIADDISYGTRYACLLRDGRLYCSDKPRNIKATEVLRAAEFRRVEEVQVLLTKIASSDSKLCAISAAGQLVCLKFWDQTYVDYFEMSFLAAGERLVNLDAGSDHFCALSNKGAIYCWGLNHVGQLGTGDTDYQIYPKRIDQGDLNFVSLDIDLAYNCAKTDDNLGYCWGLHSWNVDVTEQIYQKKYYQGGEIIASPRRIARKNRPVLSVTIPEGNVPYGSQVFAQIARDEFNKTRKNIATEIMQISAGQTGRFCAITNGTPGIEEGEYVCSGSDEVGSPFFLSLKSKIAATYHPQHFYPRYGYAEANDLRSGRFTYPLEDYSAAEALAKSTYGEIYQKPKYGYNRVNPAEAAPYSADYLYYFWRWKALASGSDCETYSYSCLLSTEDQLACDRGYGIQQMNLPGEITDDIASMNIEKGTLILSGAEGQVNLIVLYDAIRNGKHGDHSSYLVPTTSLRLSEEPFAATIATMPISTTDFVPSTAKVFPRQGTITIDKTDYNPAETVRVHVHGFETIHPTSMTILPKGSTVKGESEGNYVGGMLYYQSIDFIPLDQTIELPKLLPGQYTIIFKNPELRYDIDIALDSPTPLDGLSGSLLANKYHPSEYVEFRLNGFSESVWAGIYSADPSHIAAKKSKNLALVGVNETGKLLLDSETINLDDENSGNQIRRRSYFGGEKYEIRIYSQKNERLLSIPIAYDLNKYSNFKIKLNRKNYRIDESIRVTLINTPSLASGNYDPEISFCIRSHYGEANDKRWKTTCLPYREIVDFVDSADNSLTISAAFLQAHVYSGHVIDSFYVSYGVERVDYWSYQKVHKNFFVGKSNDFYIERPQNSMNYNHKITPEKIYQGDAVYFETTNINRTYQISLDGSFVYYTPTTTEKVDLRTLGLSFSVSHNSRVGSKAISITEVFDFRAPNQTAAEYLNYYLYTNIDLRVDVEGFCPGSFQNPKNRYDVNNDGEVTPLDVLTVKNAMAHHSYRHYFYCGKAQANPESHFLPLGTAAFLDVDGNGRLEPADALNIINEINNPALPPQGSLELQATSLSSTEIDLQWRDSSGEEKYGVYRIIPGQGAALLAQLPANITSYHVEGLDPGARAWFYVRAFNQEGSLRSANVFVDLPVAAPPSGNLELQVVALSSTAIELTWNKVEGALKYVVYRIIPGVGSKFVGHVPDASTSYQVDGLEAGRRGYFYLRAFNDYGSLRSSNVSVLLSEW